MLSHLLGILVVSSHGALSADEAVMQRIGNMLASKGFHAGITLRGARDVPFEFDGGFYNKQIGVSISVEAGQCNSAGVRDQTVKAWGRGNGQEFAERTISGLPLGDHNFVIDTDAPETGTVLYRDYVVCDRYRIMVEAEMHRGGTPDQMTARRSAVPLWCERVARLILGDAMAMDLNDDGTPRATQHLTGVEADKSGYTTLANWARVHAAAVTYDEVTAIASFSFGGKTVRLPLASSKAIVNGREVALGGKFILARGNLWLVPDRELSEAIR